MITIKEDFKYAKNADIYNPDIKMDEYYKIDILRHKYQIFNNATPYIKTHYPKYAEYLEKSYKNIMQYEPIHNSFMIQYVIMYNFIWNYNNIHIFASIPTVLETILYLKIITKTTIVQYNLNDGNPETYKKYFDNIIEKLAERYGKNTFTYNKEIIMDYNNKTLKTMKFDADLLIYNNVQQHGNKLFRTNEIQHFFYTILALNNLIIGGSYLFRWLYYSKNYLTQILSVLSKYFVKIKIIQNVMLKNDIRIYCSNYHTKIIKSDNKILLNILDKWNKLNPGGGLGLVFSDPILNTKYGINTIYDPKNHYDTFITNILNISPIPTNVKKIIEKLYGPIIENFKKIISKKYYYNKENNQITDDDLITLYKTNYKNFLFNGIELCTLYNVPIKPNYRNTLYNYTTTLINDVITIQKPLIIELVNYNKKNILTPKQYNYKTYTAKIKFDILENLKTQLNIYNFNINIYGKEKWQNINNKTNVYQYIPTFIKNKYNLNVSKKIIIMYELLHEFKLLDKNKKNIIYSNCEINDQYLHAVKHYLDYGTNFEWNGKYLDTIDKKTILKLKTQFNQTIDLFITDCKSNLSECILALEILNIGSNAIFKFIIPLSEMITLSIIYLIMIHFESIYFIKQLIETTNYEEIYIVATNKIDHLNNELENYLFDCLKNYDPELSLFPIEVFDKYFIGQIEKINEKIIKKQIKRLIRTFYYSDNPGLLEEHAELLNKSKIIYSINWIKNVKF